MITLRFLVMFLFIYAHFAWLNKGKCKFDEENFTVQAGLYIVFCVFGAISFITLCIEYLP